jgi:hypothetical protein
MAAPSREDVPLRDWIVDFTQAGKLAQQTNSEPLMRGPRLAQADAVSAPGNFVSITPCRVVDTRNPNGPFGGPQLAAGVARSFVIPSGACAIPAAAIGFSFNVTVFAPATNGFMAVYPTGPFPGTSTLNYNAGETIPNAAIVPAGPSGSIDVLSSAASHVILDINGYFTQATNLVSPGFAQGASTAPGMTINFIAAPAVVTSGGTTDTIFTTSTAALGSTSGASGLDIFICAQPAAGGPISVVGLGLFGLTSAAGERKPFTLSAAFTGLTAGQWLVGLCGSLQFSSPWNNNEWSYTSAFVVR